jgi:hypothetical protein
LLAEEIPVFIFAGQSIAMNSGTDSGQLPAAMLEPQTNVLFYNSRSSGLSEPATQDPHWTVYQPPTGRGYPSDSVYPNPTGSFGPEITAARRISETLYSGGPVAVYKYAVGATSLHYHYNPMTPGPLYAQMLERWTNALAALPKETGYTGRIAGVFWTQGESDALDGIPYCQEYASNLVNFATSLRLTFSAPRLPFVYGRITPAWPNAAYVRAGQEALPQWDSDALMVDADDLLTSTLHYDNEGTMILGNRYGAGLLAILQRRTLLAIALDGQISLQIQGLPRTRYAIEVTSALPSDWSKLTEIVTDVEGFYTFHDAPMAATNRFYRLSKITRD